MIYSKAREQIRSGDILAWTHRSWKTWYDFKIQMVRLFTQSEYSHVATAWVIGDRVFVIEAVTPLVRIFPLSKLGSFYWIPTNCKWSDTAEEFALDKVGQGYSQLQAIQAFFGKVTNDDKWECAELASRIAEIDGIDLGKLYTPSAVVNKALENDFEMHLIT
jgi:hypothetical protein